ncbi:cystatin [Fundulus heteroclitus]|uniref:cystatin n=1 Tax=Fundulus heteroclitus TaxID=8078 RepID=UPI00165C3AFE|nr:cystatin [Fundulus heteroclitus]
MLKVVFLFSGALLGFAVSQKLLGGLEKIEDAGNDEGFQRALQFAVVQHNNRTNDTHIRQVTKVVSAESQVVAGTRYIMTVILARTGCEKGQPAGNCTVHNEPQQAQPYQCTFSVWSRPWLSDTRLTDEKCTSDQPASE